MRFNFSTHSAAPTTTTTTQANGGDKAAQPLKKAIEADPDSLDSVIMPFGNFSQIVVEVYAAIMSVEPSYPKEMEGLLSPEAKNLIDGLLMKNPSKRLTIAEVVQHPFLAQ